jgi:preprotein translocase subunit SecB
MSNSVPKASYRIEDVIIVESNFKREINIDFTAGEIQNEVGLVNSAKLDEGSNKFGVFMEASISGKQNDVEVFTAKVILAGIFIKEGEGELDIETFTKINGPAMLFPFLREHIATNSLKAGMSNVLLQPLNFTKAKIDPE